MPSGGNPVYDGTATHVYCSAAYANQHVFIEISETGTGNPAEWTTVFSGDIPRAGGGGLIDSGVSIALGTGGITTRYVVITADLENNRNHSDGVFNEVGLSEVRFFGSMVEPPSARRGQSLGVERLEYVKRRVGAWIRCARVQAMDQHH